MRVGLANHVYPAAQLLVEAQKLALTIASRAPLAVSKIKRSMLEGADFGLKASLELEAKLFSECFGTHDQKEGTKAFIEKRKPVFTGK